MSRGTVVRGLTIGDRVTYEGRMYVVRGFEPMSLPLRRAELEDAETRRRMRIRVADLERAVLVRETAAEVAGRRAFRS